MKYFIYFRQTAVILYFWQIYFNLSGGERLLQYALRGYESIRKYMMKCNTGEMRVAGSCLSEQRAHKKFISF